MFEKSVGNQDEARKQGRVSMWLSVAGIIITVILIIVIPAVLVNTVGNAYDSPTYHHCGKNFWKIWDCYSCAKCLTQWSSGYEKSHCQNTC